MKNERSPKTDAQGTLQPKLSTLVSVTFLHILQGLEGELSEEDREQIASDITDRLLEAIEDGDAAYPSNYLK